MGGIVYPSALGQSRVLFHITSANMNSTADQTFVADYPLTSYLITFIRIVNASTSLTTAVGGIYSAASKGGTALVANTQAYSALTGATLGLDATIAAFGKGALTATPILSLTTPQGGAATADLYIMGTRLT